MTNARRSVLASTVSRLLRMAPGRRREADRLIAHIREQRLSYCGFPKLENIAAAVRSVEGRGVPGVFLEAGVALGGSAILIARLKSEARELRLYDVFGLIPPPSERDEQDAHKRFEEIASGRSQGLGGDGYYGYESDLYAMSSSRWPSLTWIATGTTR
jgi:asparagine synthase (glutamine-hydrolysing)